MKALADPVAELAFLPSAVIGGAKADQDVVWSKAANGVGERAQRRFVADTAGRGGFWSQRLDLTQDRPQSFVSLVPHLIRIRDKPLKPPWQHRRDDKNLRGRLDQRPDERRQLFRICRGGARNNQESRFFPGRHGSALQRCEIDDAHHASDSTAAFTAPRYRPP
jgi:hypothetical protein